MNKTLQKTLLAIGRAESRYARSEECSNINNAEFSIFSQFGEDGIIQYLLGRVPIERTAFIEIGVESYEECNTRFLLQNNNWEGLAIDSGTAHVETIFKSDLGWRHTIVAESAFVTTENINSLILDSGFAGDIGIFSLDVDGNDYWIWEALTVCSPRIVILEYNAVFGADRAVVVPYDPMFNRTEAHYSNLYWGASLKALCQISEKKGYVFVGSNSAGHNAFFVRSDVSQRVSPQSAAQGFHASRFRESRDENGKLSYISEHKARLEVIKQLPVLEIATGEVKPLTNIYQNDNY